MAKQSKRFRALAEKRKTKIALPVAEAVKALKGFDGTKFDQSVEIAIRLGIDNTQAEQIVRGSIVLPHGIGKQQRVVVFAKGAKAEEAQGGRRRCRGRRRAGREDQRRLDRVRRLHRRAGHDEAGRPAGQSARPARPDAVAARRHGDAGRRQDGRASTRRAKSSSATTRPASCRRSSAS